MALGLFSGLCSGMVVQRCAVAVGATMVQLTNARTTTWALHPAAGGEVKLGNNNSSSMMMASSNHHQQRPYHAPSAASSAAVAQAQAREEHYPLPIWGDAAPRIKALLVDAAGTLLLPSEPVADVYLRYAARHGVARGLTPAKVLANFRRAYNTPYSGSARRYVGDGRPFWRGIVAASVEADVGPLFDDLYDYYARPEAWRLAPGAAAALRRVRAAGVRAACVSNFDTRLRPILEGLGAGGALFDAVVVSAEIGAEKPSPVIFEAAARALGVAPRECIHVGDDRRNDVFGARDAGATAWLWGGDVRTFDEVARRVLYMQRAGLVLWDAEQ